MGLLDGTTNRDYYQGNDFGNYQFTSLADIINQFMVVYVGENKMIPKASKVDVAFHAQRALRELSFDTLKSVKSQQIDLPPTLVMSLPQDYVNYTKLSWVDASGIKHPLYPTNSTSNPFEIKQNDDGSYFFGEEANRVLNASFDDGLNSWNHSNPAPSKAWGSTKASPSGKYYTNYIDDTFSVTNGALSFGQLWHNGYAQMGSRAYAAWQRIDVTGVEDIEFFATATSGARQTDAGGTLICDYGVVRVGVTSTNPNTGWVNTNGSLSPALNTAPGGNNQTPNKDVSNYDLGYVEWSDGTASQKEIESINVSAFDEVWVYIQSFSPWNTAAVTANTHVIDFGDDGVAGGTGGDADTIGVPNGGTIPILPESSVNNTHQKNTVDSISIIVPGQTPTLTHANTDGSSSTWNNYKANTPSENQDDYEDDTYWKMNGNRYGLDPQYAQANGSFYIDTRLGRIHFSSNISGKTVILDYISDSLGTDSEMQVHKFAEDAMYKWITHAVLSASSYGQPLVPRLTKEKFAAIRKAKLRLSNIKLEELTQILRGKSKQIKH
tara:strand:- start:12124 stop:13776 length:1653 start_codon:yes stop_codon:yes gene_type:complete